MVVVVVGGGGGSGRSPTPLLTGVLRRDTFRVLRRDDLGSKTPVNRARSDNRQSTLKKYFENENENEKMKMKYFPFFKKAFFQGKFLSFFVFAKTFFLEIVH